MTFLSIDATTLIPVFTFLFAVIVIISIFYFEKKRHFLREIRKTPFQSISRANENEYVKLAGIAKHVREPLRAPLSNRECIFYQVKVEEKRDKNGWRTIIDDVSSTDFFLASGDEMAIVKMAQPYDFRNIILKKDHIKKSGLFNDANENLEAYLRRHNKKSTFLIGLNKSIRYSEGIIELEEKVVVKGIAKWKLLKDVIPGYNYSKILTLNGSKVEKLLITDLEEAIDKGLSK